MATLKKIIVSSKNNLQTKYGKKFSVVEKLLADLIVADKKRNVDTQIIYIDDSLSAKKAKITAVASITRQSAKNAVDELFNKTQPAYIVLFGAQDIFPFQEISNPAKDDDDVVPSDLPYACDTPYNTKISAFTGPTRVVGRIPDIPAKPDVDYLKKVINIIIKYKPVKVEKLMEYFSVTAAVWTKSTQQSLNSIFGNSSRLKISPPAVTGYPAADLKPLIHFYNCHGSPIDSKYYGQAKNNFPTAIDSPDLNGKVFPGTIIAAESCYGAQLYNPKDDDNNQLSIANTYFKNKAIGFIGSSTIAYGPADSQGLADLITQYFIKSVLKGASTGRAMLEARQKFLSVVGPQLDPYELKTLAQFYLLGDPSLKPVIEESSESEEETVENRRIKLFCKGLDLAATIAPSALISKSKIKAPEPPQKAIDKIFKDSGFTGKEKDFLYKVKSRRIKSTAFSNSMTGGQHVTFRAYTQDVTFRAYIKESKRIKEKFNISKVLVIKQNGTRLLGWRVYYVR
jgi:hypothetical protein